MQAMMEFETVIKELLQRTPCCRRVMETRFQEQENRQWDEMFQLHSEDCECSFCAPSSCEPALAEVISINDAHLSHVSFKNVAIAREIGITVRNVLKQRFKSQTSYVNLNRVYICPEN